MYVYLCPCLYFNFVPNQKISQFQMRTMEVYSENHPQFQLWASSSFPKCDLKKKKKIGIKGRVQDGFLGFLAALPLLALRPGRAGPSVVESVMGFSWSQQPVCTGIAESQSVPLPWSRSMVVSYHDWTNTINVDINSRSAGQAAIGKAITPKPCLLWIGWLVSICPNICLYNLCHAYATTVNYQWCGGLHDMTT